MTSSRGERFEYWNTVYPEYWRRRVDEANTEGDGRSGISKGDSKVVGDDELDDLLGMIPLQDGQEVLDLGCGFGRAFPFFLERGCRVTGTDIAPSILEMVPDELKRDERVTLLQAEAEALPFDEATFDHVAALGAFDAFEQHLGLSEMLRVCRPGGHIFFTAKHSRYCEDDEPALVAERNARKKGHPNFFTEFDALLSALKPAAEIVKVRYYVRRDDFLPMKYVEDRPPEFYNYNLLARRNSAPARRLTEPIASEFSETWRRLHGRDEGQEND